MANITTHRRLMKIITPLLGIVAVCGSGCVTSEADRSCDELTQWFATCYPEEPPLTSDQCTAELLDRADTLLAMSCEDLDLGAADALAMGGCGEGEVPCYGGFFCCDAQKVEFWCDNETEGQWTTIYVQGCSDVTTVMLQRHTCSALGLASSTLDLLTRASAGEATAEEAEGLSLWFGYGERPLEELALSTITETVEATHAGLLSLPNTYVCETEGPCAETSRGMMYTKSFDPPLFGVCPYFEQEGSDAPFTILHEATHVHAGTLDHGYGGPCTYLLPVEGAPNAFLDGRLGEQDLLENADTYERWMTDAPPLPMSGMESPVDGVCPAP